MKNIQKSSNLLKLRKYYDILIPTVDKYPKNDEKSPKIPKNIKKIMKFGILVYRLHRWKILIVGQNGHKMALNDEKYLKMKKFAEITLSLLKCDANCR